MNVSSFHYTTKIRKMKIKISLLSLLVHQNLFALGQICTGNVNALFFGRLWTAGRPRSPDERRRTF